MKRLSHRRILTALTNLGLTKTDGQVYTFLATKGPQRTQEIMERLKLQEQPLLQSLEFLRKKGVVSLKQEHYVFFVAMPFHEALELLLKEHLQQAQAIEQNKAEALSEWKNATRGSKRKNATT